VGLFDYFARALALGFHHLFNFRALNKWDIGCIVVKLHRVQVQFAHFKMNIKNFIVVP
jgi:hypothetical protein